MSLLRKLVEAHWIEAQGSVPCAADNWVAERHRLVAQQIPNLNWLDFSAWLAVALGGLVGFMTMSGLLLVNSQQSVNVLLFLAVAIVLPWLIKMGAWLLPKRSGEKVWQRHWLVSQFFWSQLQLASSLVAILTYLFWLTVTDITFVWQSTLLVDYGALANALNIFALPWQWLWPSAGVSAELLAASQSYTAGTFQVSVESSKDWWQFLLAAMLVWVALPRLLDLLRYRWLVGKTLVALEAGPMHQHLQRHELESRSHVQQQRATAQVPNSGELPDELLYLAWRNNLAPDLASMPFNDAQLKISQSPLPVAVHIYANTTPTAELADLCQLQPRGWIVLHDVDQPADLLSWQQFIGRFLPSWYLESS